MANEAVRVVMVLGGGSSGQVRVLQVTGAGSGTGRVIVTNVAGATPGLFTIDAGLPQTLDPFQAVQLNAVIVGTGTVDQWVWIQTGGLAVYLVGSGPSVQYRAPATMNGTTLTFMVTATTGGTAAPPATVTHTVRAHSGMWKVTATGRILYGVERRRKARIPLVAVLPTSLGGANLGTRNLGV